MWNPDNRVEFEQVVKDLLQDPDVQALRHMGQHSKHCNRLDHSVYVAYLSFLFCRRFRLDYVAAARAGLLHDFHFADEEAGIRRLWRHPWDALENAEGKYALTAKEKDIIVKHMWPLPRHRETFVVSMADKVCALLEMCRIYKLLKVSHHLQPVAA